MILPKTLDYTPTSTTQILANIRAPSTCPLRVDFGGGALMSRCVVVLSLVCLVVAIVL